MLRLLKYLNYGKWGLKWGIGLSNQYNPFPAFVKEKLISMQCIRN